MADNKLDILVDLKVQENRVKRELSKLNEVIQTADRRTKKYKNAVREVVKAEMELANIRKQRISTNKSLENSEKSLIKTQKQAKDATGATTSSVLELGRVISDAPYGIRGMANNLTQLVSQLAFATKASGGLGKALKGMWTAMMGPLGVVLAITGVIALLDEFYGANEKAEESTSSFREEVEELADIMSYNLNVSIQDYLKLMQRKKQIDKSMEEKSEKLKELEEDLAEVVRRREIYERNMQTAVHNRSLIQKSLNQIIAKEKGIMDEIDAIYKEATGSVNEFNKMKEAAQIGDLKTVASMEKMISSLKRERKNTAQNSREWGILTSQIDAWQKKIEAIKGRRDKKESTNKLSFFKSPKELEVDVQNQEKALLNLSKKLELQQLSNKEKEELATAKTEEEKEKIKKKYDEQRLEKQISFERQNLELSKKTERAKAKAKHDAHVDELERIFAEYKLKIELDKKLSKEQKESLIGEAKSKKDKAVVQAGGEKITSLREIDDSYSPLFELFDKLADARRKALGIGGEDGEGGEQQAKELDMLSFYAERAKEILGGISEFINAESERQLAIEQNKTNALNEELNNRLLNENLSKNERARIQNQIWQNDEKLRKKQNEIRKKQFNANKAFNISTALIDTYLSASKAYASQLTVPTPDAPIRAKIAAGVAVASGLAKVAAIARQKFQPESATTPVRTASGGGGGGGVGDRSFNFNLVGANQQNQILSSIQSQLDKPVKAYVVSKDISSAQQLEANTRSTARFGG